VRRYFAYEGFGTYEQPANPIHFRSIESGLLMIPTNNDWTVIHFHHYPATWIAVNSLFRDWTPDVVALPQMSGGQIAILSVDFTICWRAKDIHEIEPALKSSTSLSAA
jgi:hypothetical protein